MKEKKSINIILLVLVIILLAMLVYSMYCVTKFKNAFNILKNEENIKLQNEKEQTSIELVDTYEGEKEYQGRYLELNYSEEIIEDGGERYNSMNGYAICYHFNGKKLTCYNDNNEEVQIIAGKTIKQFEIGTTYSGLMWEAEYENGEGKKYEFVSTLYVLFEDGTVGKISTDDIKNKNYKITMLDKYKNTEYFIEGTLLNSGADVNLYAVDKDSKGYFIDMVRAGT